jgi:YtkA-like
MRPAIVAAVLLVGLSTAGCGGSKKKAAFGGAGECPPPASTASAGSAQISAQALGGRYSKLVVVHAKEKSDGAPVHGGRISVHAEMTCPMFMRLIAKKMQETSPGTYKAGYSLVMPGQWAFYFVLRDKNGDATTSAFPLTVKAPGS